jgi:hypothetical protein
VTKKVTKLATRLRAGRRRAAREHERASWIWKVAQFRKKVRKRGGNSGNDPVKKYILLDGKPCLLGGGMEDLVGWAMWLETSKGERILGHTQVGRVFVSTVFLGLDHNLSGDGPPVLWETMVFGADEDPDWRRFQRRYSSQEAAIEGHRQAVDELKHGIVVVPDEEL